MRTKLVRQTKSNQSVHVGEYIALNEESLWSANDENLEACHQLVKRICQRHNLNNNNVVGETKR